MQINIWIEDIEELIETHPLESFGNTVPCIGDFVSIQIDKDNRDYFVVAERCVSPGKHWTLYVKPISGKGFEFKKKLAEEGMC